MGDIKVKDYFLHECKSGKTSEEVIFFFMSKYHLWSEQITIEKALVKYGGRKIEPCVEISNNNKLRKFNVSGNQRLKWEKENK